MKLELSDIDRELLLKELRAKLTNEALTNEIRKNIEHMVLDIARGTLQRFEDDIKSYIRDEVRAQMAKR